MNGLYRKNTKLPIRLRTATKLIRVYRNREYQGWIQNAVLGKIFASSILVLAENAPASGRSHYSANIGLVRYRSANPVVSNADLP